MGRTGEINARRILERGPIRKGQRCSQRRWKDNIKGLLDYGFLGFDIPKISTNVSEESADSSSFYPEDGDRKFLQKILILVTKLLAVTS
jgi:hypothetical protein